MIFDNVKAFTIPNGVVEKVSFGEVVLWEAGPIFPSWYKCDPVISITCESRITNTNSHKCGFSCSISGITRDLISDVQIVSRYYRDTASGTQLVQQSQYPYALPDNAITENKYSFYQYVTHAVSSLNYGHSFALRITYTDLDGNKKILTTGFITSSVGASATAKI